MLLYPTTNESLALDYEIHGHRVHVRTLDLAQDWQVIRASLLGLVDSAISDSRGLDGTNELPTTPAHRVALART